MTRSPSALALAALGSAIFLPLYAVVPRLRLPWVAAVIIAMVGLALAFLASNPGASVFFVYAAAECGRLGPVRRAAAAIAAIVAVAGVSAAMLERSVAFWLPICALVIVIGISGIHERLMERKNLEIRRSREEVERLARIAERERIARDLHDLLGHSLSVVILKAELARKLAARDPERAAAEMAEVEAVARKALEEVRGAVAAYRAESLLGELDNARTALGAAGVVLEVEAEPVRLPPLHEGVLALALREAVTNVVRHAAATRCRVAVRSDGDAVRLVVEDDGRGGGGEGHGLQGMRERVASLGGALERDGAAGTRLAIELPLPPETPRPVEGAA